MRRGADDEVVKVVNKPDVGQAVEDVGHEP